MIGKHHRRDGSSSDIEIIEDQRPRIPCPSCKESFHDVAMVNLHLQNDHHDGTTKVCRHCTMAYANQTTYEHMILDCRISNQLDASFRQNVNPEAALKSANEEDTLTKTKVQCQLCDKHFSLVCSLQRHYRKNHHVSVSKANIRKDAISTWQMPTSQVRIVTSSDVANGNVQVSPTKPSPNNQCQICLVSFPTDRQLKGHYQEWHKVVVPLNRIQDCGKAQSNTSSSSQLVKIGQKRKRESEDGKKKKKNVKEISKQMYQCQLCDKTLAWDFNLQTHYRQLHDLRVSVHDIRLNNRVKKDEQQPRPGSSHGCYLDRLTLSDFIEAFKPDPPETTKGPIKFPTFMPVRAPGSVASDDMSLHDDAPDDLEEKVDRFVTIGGIFDDLSLA